MRFRLLFRTLPLILSLVLALPRTAAACAACFGQSNSALAEGMNWGIFTLLVIVACVLVGVAAFFVYLARRAGAASGPVSPLDPPTSPRA